jgi:hypothetical protein
MFGPTTVHKCPLTASIIIVKLIVDAYELIQVLGQIKAK